jgi:hypothetical protein
MTPEVGDLGGGSLLLGFLLVIFQPLGPCLLLDLRVERLCPLVNKSQPETILKQ